jgi:hypothetical protein
LKIYVKICSDFCRERTMGEESFFSRKRGRSLPPDKDPALAACRTKFSGRRGSVFFLVSRPGSAFAGEGKGARFPPDAGSG